VIDTSSTNSDFVIKFDRAISDSRIVDRAVFLEPDIAASRLNSCPGTLPRLPRRV